MQTIAKIITRKEEKINEAEALKNSIASASIPAIAKPLEVALKAVEQEIQALDAEIALLEANEELNNKDWDSLATEYPVLEQALKDIRNVSASITFNTDLYRNTLKQAQRGLLNSILLYGPTGTGKTTFLRKIGSEIGRPVISINASNGLKEEDVFGSYVIDPETGKPKFILGPLIIAMLTGAFFVIEEINGAKQAVLLKVNSILDDLKQVYIKETGMTYKCAPGFVFGGTFNPGYAGTRKLNKALINRFEIVADIQEMTETQLKSALKSKIKDIKEYELEVCWFVFKGVLNGLKLNELDGAISIRQMLSMVKYYRVHNDEYFQSSGKNKSWTQAIDFAVKGQVSGGDEDIAKLVSNVAKSLVDNTDKSTGVIKDNYKIPGEQSELLKGLTGMKEMSQVKEEE